MARAYQESHMLESLSSSTKALQSQVAELAKLSGLHEERIQKLMTANTELAAKNAALETRIVAKYISPFRFLSLSAYLLFPQNSLY